MVVVDGVGVPLGVLLEGTNRAECRLVERLRARGVDLIAPHRRNLNQPTQDGRKLQRYRRRWIVERTIAWLLDLRRLTVRWERKAEHYLAFLHLACAMIALRRVLK